jgi:hypothetical protein
MTYTVPQRFLLFFLEVRVKLKSAVLLSSALLSTAAFAQEAAPKAAEPAKVMKEVVPYGVLQSYTNLMDSQRKNTPEFGQVITQFGLKISEGVAKGQIEVRMAGNTGDPKSDGKIMVRRADLGLDLASGTSIRLGRTRFGNPTTYGLEATPTFAGFGATDGLMVSQMINISEGNTLKLKAIVGNAASVIAPDVTGPGYKYGGENTGTDSKFIAVGFDAKISGVDAGVYYGMDSKAQLQGEAAAVAADAAKGIEKADAKVAAYGDFSHLEASLGYGVDGIAGGITYQQFNWGELKSGKNEGGKITTGDVVKKGKTTLTQLIVGLNGDTTLFGAKDFLQTGDMFTYGASFAMATARNSASEGDAKTAEKDADVTQIVVGGGYKVAGLGFELNFANSQTKGKTFANDKGEAAQKTSANKLFISSVYEF